MTYHATSEYYATIFEGWQDSDAVADQLAFRKRLFVDELGWKLQHSEVTEQDEFDTPNALYCSLYLRDQIVGCWRGIRTSEPYLGKLLFPELAEHRPYPIDSDIWEISRLGVIRHPERGHSAQITYALMFYLAISRKALSLCGVVSPFHNRNLVINGVKTSRFGKTRVVGVDAKGRDISAFFGEIPMSDQSQACMDKLMGPINSLELRDEALVRRSTRISA